MINETGGFTVIKYSAGRQYLQTYADNPMAWTGCLCYELVCGRIAEKA